MGNSFDFSTSNVFVAGGTSGINLGIAEAFAAAGATASVHSRSEEKVSAAVAKLESYGGTAAGFAADVRDPQAISEALGAAHETFGPFDVLISGAAGNFPAPALGISSNGFRAVMEIDVLGTFHVLRFGHQYLKTPGASVINISAPQAYIPMPLQIHVCAAKAGVDMITRVLSMEWGPQGIRVNSIVPGPIEGTEGMKRLAPTPEAEARSREAVPLGRWGTTRDIANMAMFLASPFASYVSGAVIPVDGAMTVSNSGLSTNEIMKAIREGVAG